MSGEVRVKICGLTNLDDARAAVDAGASALGFNFYPRSIRYVRPEMAAEIVAQLPRSICTVGVFVNEPRESIAAIVSQVGLTAIQFHGDESPEFCRSWTQKVVKALRVRDGHAAAIAQRYAVDFILADAYVEGQRGGARPTTPALPKN